MLSAAVATIALLLSLVTAAPAVASSAPSTPTALGGGMAKAAAVSGFDAENIISDALFYDGSAMTASQIQSFLNQKIGTCLNGKCLNVLTTGISSRDAVYSQSTGNLICSAIKGGSMKVAELIYRVQKACGISAKVILVTLQKEQGLTTSKEPSTWNLKAAMGASCPDTAPCDPTYAGVGPQILKGTQQLKTYKAARFAKQPGVNYVGYSPKSSCGGTNLNIRNYATAALYSYTPYQPNKAALKAGYGLGDSCSSYGNRNFYNYYTAWFGSTQGGSSAGLCAQPFEPTAAHKSYVVKTATTARKAPTEECTSGAKTLAAGTIVTATAASDDKLWIKVHVETADLWIRRDAARYATDAETSCALPSSSTASKTYVVLADAAARTAPDATCESGSATVAAGTIATATAVSADKDWIKLALSQGPLWVARDQVRYATTDETRCAEPASTSTATLGYVVKPGGTTARTAPSTLCAAGAVDLPAGTPFTATEVTAARDWLALQLDDGREVWVPRADVGYASSIDVCDLGGASTTAQRTYVLLADGTARTEPSAGCADGATTVAAGTAATAVAVTAEKDWLKLALPQGQLWVPRDQVRYATTAEAACAAPTTPATASLAYVVKPGGTIVRSAPSTACAASTTKVAAGTPFTATATTASRDWLKFSLGDGRDVWVPRADVEYASRMDVCDLGGATAAAKKTYVLKADATARTAPSAGCGTGTASVTAGSVATAVEVTAERDWVKLALPAGPLWVPRDQIRYATKAEAACIAPATTLPAKLSYTVGAAGTTARIAPSAGCTVSSIAIAAGTTFTATATTPARDWLRFRTGDGREVWVPRADVASR